MRHMLLLNTDSTCKSFKGSSNVSLGLTLRYLVKFKEDIRLRHIFNGTVGKHNIKVHESRDAYLDVHIHQMSYYGPIHPNFLPNDLWLYILSSLGAKNMVDLLASLRDLSGTLKT